MSSPLTGRFAGRLHVASYGAAGDGVTDDGPALQRAMNDAFDLNQPLDFDGKNYVTYQELDNKGITMRGCRGSAPTQITAGIGTSLTSVIKVTGVTFMHDFTINGNGYAKHAVRLISASYSVFENVKFYYTVSDGLNSEGNSDTVILRNCMSQSTGTIYRTSGGPLPTSGATKVIVPGTVSTTSGSQTLTFDTAHDWAAMGLRVGDFIVIAGATAAYADSEILCVGAITDSTHLETHRYQASSRNAAGKGFAILIGDGVRQEPSGDNNNWYITTYRCLNVAGTGLSFAGLYGPCIDQLQADACGGPAVKIGSWTDLSAQAPCIVSRITGLYVESFSEIPSYAVFGSSFANLEITDVKFGGTTFYTPNASLGYGTVRQVLSDPGTTRSIGDAGVDYTLKARLYRAQATDEFLFVPKGVVAVAGTTIDATHAAILWVNGNPGTMTAVPTISAGAEGQILHVFYTDNSGSITLQSESVLGSSGLKLQSNRVTLGERDCLSLVYTNGKWREVSRSVVAAPNVGDISSDGTLTVSSSLGAGGSDTVIKAGTTVANASVNATAKLFTVNTGIGGSEVEYLTVTRNGVYFNGYPNSAFSCSGSWVDLGVLPIRSPSYFVSANSGTAFYANANGAFGALNTAKLWSEGASGASDIATKLGTYIADGSVNAATKLASFRTGMGGVEVEKAYFDKGFGLVVNDSVEIGGNSGTAYRDANVALTFNSISKNWLFNGYNGGSHIMSLARIGRFALNGAIAVATASTAPATAVIRSAAVMDEAVFRVEQRSTYVEPIQQWVKNSDTTPAVVSTVVTDGTFVQGGNVAFGEVVVSRTGVAQGQVGYYPSASEIGLYNANAASGLAFNLGTGNSRASGTFSSAGFVSASTASLYSTALGGNAADIATKIGTTVADASVNAAARIATFRTGIGGSEVESLFVTKGGTLNGGTAGVLRLNNTVGAQLDYGGVTTFSLTSIYGSFLGPGPLLVENNAADAADLTVLYANCRSAWTTTSSNLLYLQNDEQDRVRVNPLGMFRIWGTDSSASPGAATINKPIGISAIASGTSSVVITNSLVTTGSHILITWHNDHGATRDYVTRAAGSFTVKLDANASNDASFSWEVKGLL